MNDLRSRLLSFKTDNILYVVENYTLSEICNEVMNMSLPDNIKEILLSSIVDAKLGYSDMAIMKKNNDYSEYPFWGKYMKVSVSLPGKTSTIRHKVDDDFKARDDFEIDDDFEARDDFEIDDDFRPYRNESSGMVSGFGRGTTLGAGMGMSMSTGLGGSNTARDDNKKRGTSTEKLELAANVMDLVTDIASMFIK